MLVGFHKPFRVLSQFSSAPGKATLADYLALPGMYPAGRLDYDSEGLLLLTDDGRLQHWLSHPRHKQTKVYWAQVEGVPSDAALAPLRKGVLLNDGWTRPAVVDVMAEPANLWPRDPPIRYRAEIPTCWLRLQLQEGRNRQVRRMTAAIGFPTLRLIRYSIGPWTLEGLEPGHHTVVDARLNLAQINPNISQTDEFRTMC